MFVQVKDEKHWLTDTQLQATFLFVNNMQILNICWAFVHFPYSQLVLHVSFAYVMTVEMLFGPG